MKNKNMRDLQKHWAEQAKKAAKKAASTTAPKGQEQPPTQDSAKAKR